MSTMVGGLTPEQTRAVEIAKAQAIGYVWGRQDAGESMRDTGLSTDFGQAYAEAKQEYLTERRGSLPNIQAAWFEWRETQRITDGRHYVA